MHQPNILNSYRKENDHEPPQRPIPPELHAAVARAGQEAPGLQHGHRQQRSHRAATVPPGGYPRLADERLRVLPGHARQGGQAARRARAAPLPRGELARVAAVHPQGTRRARLDRGADPDRADRHLRRALCRGARAVQREGTLDADLPRDGHQRLEPRQRGLPPHARRARQGLRSGQGRACLSRRASEPANAPGRLALYRFPTSTTAYSRPRADPSAHRATPAPDTHPVQAPPAASHPHPRPPHTDQTWRAPSEPPTPSLNLGRMFWLWWKTLSGSYVVFTSTSRS